MLLRTVRSVAATAWATADWAVATGGAGGIHGEGEGGGGGAGGAGGGRWCGGEGGGRGGRGGEREGGGDEGTVGREVAWAAAVAAAEVAETAAAAAAGRWAGRRRWRRQVADARVAHGFDAWWMVCLQRCHRPWPSWLPRSMYEYTVAGAVPRSMARLIKLVKVRGVQLVPAV